MSRLTLDLRVAARTAVRARFVSVLAAIAFALGITTAVFSIFNGVLLAPLPFPQPDRLVMVYDTQPACATCPASFPKYRDWCERNQVFSAIGGSMSWSCMLTGRGDPIQLRAAKTTSSLGDVFGVRPRLGRWYSEDEDQPGGPKGRGAVVGVLDAATRRRSVDRRPEADSRRRAVRGPRRDAAGLRAPARRRVRAVAAEAGSGDARLPLPRHLCPAEARRHAGARPR
jgi:hypothetical protein